MNIQYKDLLKAIRAIGRNQIQVEHPLNTMDEHWGDEEEQRAEETIAAYRGQGRRSKKDVQTHMVRGIVCNGITCVAPKAIREQLVSVSKQQGYTISDYVVQCIGMHLSPDTLIPPHKTIIDIGPQSPIPIDHSQDSRDLYMSTEEVSSAIGCSKTKIGHMAKEGELPCIKVGKAFVFKKKDIKHYLRNREKQ